jgi:hypothetical protein
MTTNGSTGGGMLKRFDVKGFPWLLFVPALDYGADAIQ